MNQKREADMRADFTTYVRLEIAIVQCTMTDELVELIERQAQLTHRWTRRRADRRQWSYSGRRRPASPKPAHAGAATGRSTATANGPRTPRSISAVSTRPTRSPPPNGPGPNPSPAALPQTDHLPTVRRASGLWANHPPRAPGRGPYRQRPQLNSRRSYRRHLRPRPEPHQPRPRLTQHPTPPCTHTAACAGRCAAPITTRHPPQPERATTSRLTHQPGIRAHPETRDTRNQQHHSRIHCPRHRHLPQGADAHHQRTTRTQRPRTALHQCRNTTHHHAVTTRTGRPRTQQRGRAHRHRPRTRNTSLQIDPARMRKHHIEPHTLRQRPVPHRLTGHHPGHILRRRLRQLHQHPRRLPLHCRRTAHNSRPFPYQAVPTAHPHARPTSLQTHPQAASPPDHIPPAPASRSRTTPEHQSYRGLQPARPAQLPHNHHPAASPPRCPPRRRTRQTNPRSPSASWRSRGGVGNKVPVCPFARPAATIAHQAPVRQAVRPRCAAGAPPGAPRPGTHSLLQADRRNTPTPPLPMPSPSPPNRTAACRPRTGAPPTGPPLLAGGAGTPKGTKSKNATPEPKKEQ